MKTLNDCKKEIAKSLGMPWEKILLDRTLMDTVVEGVARRYAEQQAIEFAYWIMSSLERIEDSDGHEYTMEEIYKQFKEEQK